MLLRLVVTLIICSIYSCTTTDHLIDDLPLDSEGIAQKIAESQLFIETGKVSKELNALMLSDILDNAKTLNDDEVEELSNTTEVAGFLKERQYKNAIKISEVNTELETLNQQLIIELELIKAKIGDDKYNEVREIIGSKYKHLYRLSAEEGLTIADEIKAQ